MTAATVLEAFAAAGVPLREDAGQVTYRAPFGTVTPAMRAALRDNENELIKLLRTGADKSASPNSLHSTRTHETTAPPEYSGRFLAKGAEPAEPSLLRDGVGGQDADLVRCADCRNVHYRSEPPPIPGNPWKEWLVCDHGHAVTMHELTTRSRGCAQFIQRTPAAEPRAEGSAAA